MKKITTIVALALATLTATAQSTKESAEAQEAKLKGVDFSKMKDGWIRVGALQLGTNWINTSNWVGASEKFNIGINGVGSFTANRKKGKSLWLNDANLTYGTVMTPSTQGTFRKNQDLLTASSMYAMQIKPKWYYAFSGDLRTQATLGYNYASPVAGGGYARTTGFMSPGFIRAGVGIMYTPNTKMRVYFSPLTANIVTKLGKDFAGVEMAGVKANEKIAFGLGALLRADYANTFKTGTVLGDLVYKTRFDAFTNYLDNPFGKIDIDWINNIGFQVTKNIAVSGVINTRYYHNVLQNLQYMHNFGIGLSKTF
ncbi:MAG: hypothetical protein RL660_525 [Bacteroidota bacterium]|jgi:hypothetical protein